MRPTSAGLAKLCPSPPNNCFTTTMEMNAPMVAIHSGKAGGKLKARIRPVTTAEKSPTGSGFLRTRHHKSSKQTQAATVTPHSSSTRAPKMTVEATSVGSKATTTTSITRRVEFLLSRCGEGET